MSTCVKAKLEAVFWVIRNSSSKSRIKVECRILSEMKRVSVSIWRIGSINLLGVPVIFAAGHLLMKPL